MNNSDKIKASGVQISDIDAEDNFEEYADDWRDRDLDKEENLNPEFVKEFERKLLKEQHDEKIFAAKVIVLLILLVIAIFFICLQVFS